MQPSYGRFLVGMGMPWAIRMALSSALAPSSPDAPSFMKARVTLAGLDRKSGAQYVKP